MIAAVYFSGFFFALGSLCLCGLLKIVSDMQFCGRLKILVEFVLYLCSGFVADVGNFDPCRAVDKDSKLRLILY